MKKSFYSLAAPLCAALFAFSSFAYSGGISEGSHWRAPSKSIDSYQAVAVSDFLFIEASASALQVVSFLSPVAAEENRTIVASDVARRYDIARDRSANFSPHRTQHRV